MQGFKSPTAVRGARAPRYDKLRLSRSDGAWSWAVHCAVWMLSCAASDTKLYMYGFETLRSITRAGAVPGRRRSALDS